MCPLFQAATQCFSLQTFIVLYSFEKTICHSRKSSYFCSRFRKVESASKKSIAFKVLAFEFAKFKKEDGAFMLSLECVCYNLSISSGVRLVPYPVPSRCLAIPNANGREHIASRFSLWIWIMVPLEGSEQKQTQNEYKENYSCNFNNDVMLCYASTGCP